MGFFLTSEHASYIIDKSYPWFFIPVISIDISTLDGDDLKSFFDRAISDFWNFELTITYLADYAQSKMIRDGILYLFEKNNINVPWKNRFALISDELVNNSIEYGSLPLDKNHVYVLFSHAPEESVLKVMIEVSDTGRGTEAKTSQEMEEIRKLRELQGFDSYLGKRGRGLFQLITNLVDELYFRDSNGGGLIVGVRKELEILQPSEAWLHHDQA